MVFVLDELVELYIRENSPLVKEGDGSYKYLYIYYNNLMGILEKNKDGIDGEKYRKHLEELVTETIAVDSPINVRINRYCTKHNLPLWVFRERPIEERAELLALDSIDAMQEIVDRSHQIQIKSRNKKGK